MTHAQEGMIDTAGVHLIVMAVVAVYLILVSVSVLVTGCRNRGRLRIASSFSSTRSLISPPSGFDGEMRDRKSSSAVSFRRKINS